MVNTTTALPAGLVTEADAERLRTLEAVEMFVLLDRPEMIEHHRGARNALLLANETLLIITLTKDGWNQQVLERDAERIDLLDKTMARLSKQREA